MVPTKSPDDYRDEYRRTHDANRPGMVRVISLADTEGMPSVTALCDTTGWNGFHVPLMSADTLRDHFRDCAAVDRDGTWDDVHVAELSPAESDTEHGVIVMWDDANDGESTSWSLNAAGLAWIDGLVWSDAS